MFRVSCFGFPSEQHHLPPIEKTQGFCIRRVDYSETSQIVTFYTREAGRVSLMAKGSRRKKSPTQGRIDLLSCGELVYIPKRFGALSILTEYKPGRLFRGIREALPRSYAAFHLAELIDRSMHEGESDAAFYDFCVGTLDALAGGAPPGVCRLIFEAHFLDQLGVAPQLGSCQECSRPVPMQGEVAYSVVRGGPLCGDCCQPDTLRVPVGALGVIEGLRRAPASAAARIRIAPELLHDASDILQRCVCYTLEREPKMYRHM